MLNTHSRVDEDHNFTSVKTPSFRGSQVFCARHTPRSLLISPNTLISVLLRNTFRSPCLFPTHSDHRASSQHTQVTVPLPNTFRLPCLSSVHSDHHCMFSSRILSSNHCSPPNTLISLLILPNTITKLKLPQHSPRTLRLSRSEHTHFYAEDSLSGRCPILQSSQPVVPLPSAYYYTAEKNVHFLKMLGTLTMQFCTQSRVL